VQLAFFIPKKYVIRRFLFQKSAQLDVFIPKEYVISSFLVKDNA
jgi:hypothetical protein